MLSVAAQVVFRKDVAICGNAAMSARTVPGILEAWAGQLGTLQALRAMHAELQALLQQRAGMHGPDAQTADMVCRRAISLHAVRQPKPQVQLAHVMPHLC